MKHSLSFLAGASLTTGAVVLAGGYHAGMVILGGILTVTLLVVLVWGLGIPRVARWLLALHNANSESPRVATPGRRKKDNLGKTNVVQFPDVLSTVQQQVVSALVNLQVPMAKAQKTVTEASQGRPGIDFDTLFRMCVQPPRKAVNA